jgi:malate dehydrogenase (oxaloacetate-decarboxylating)(NADP+)
MTISKDAAHTEPEKGMRLLRGSGINNKSLAFSPEERRELGLRGLLPARINTMDEQVQILMSTFRSKSTLLDKYVYLMDMQQRRSTLFYRALIDHMSELLPIVYTPTVGLACQEYSHIYVGGRGLFISEEYKGEIEDVLANWPEEDIRVIVVTDGERILGLGDLGANGMGIPLGKLALYTACAGIHPSQCLPITIDVGTDTEALRSDIAYIGLVKPRTRGPAYDELIDEFVRAVEKRFPKALIQFEDFGNQNAFRLLERYRHQSRVFNDDIQGTAAVTLAGLLSALHMTGRPLTDQTILFLGAGEAGIGIGDLIVSAMMEQGMSEADARKRCWFVDSKGLVVASRTDLAEHKKRFAHDHAFVTDLLTAVEALRPTALIGASGMPQTFTEPVVKAMAQMNAQPIIFALSNPTSKSECTAEQAYTWTNGRAVFASGSPFSPVTLNGRIIMPGQANNSYIFPGVGLGILASEARHVTDAMFLAAAKALVAQVTDDDWAQGCIFPPLAKIRQVSAAIATAVAEVAYASGLADFPRPADLRAHVVAQMYDPRY